MRFPYSLHTAFVLGAIAIVCALLLIFAHGPERDSAPTQTENGQKSTATPYTTDTDRDSDADGLKDWEERLWGTSETQADSDGDGTPDGAEVDAGRNPAVAGPDDDIRTAPATAVYQEQENTAQNTTQETNLADTKATASADTPENAETDKKTPENAELQTYGNTIGAVIQAHIAASQRDAAVLKTLTEQIAATNTPIQSEIMVDMAKRYQEYARTSGRISVPNSVQSSLYNVIQPYQDIAAALNAIATGSSERDAVVANLQTYRDATVSWRDAFLSLRRFFTDRDIGFTPREPGYIFTQSF